MIIRFGNGLNPAVPGGSTETLSVVNYSLFVDAFDGQPVPTVDDFLAEPMLFTSELQQVLYLRPER